MKRFLSLAKRGFSDASRCQTVAAAFILLWRVSVKPWNGLWRDWIALVALHWICATLSRENGYWLWVTICLMGLLVGIYAFAQVPQSLIPLDIETWW